MTEKQVGLLVLLIIGVSLVSVGMTGLVGYRRRGFIFPLEYGYVTGGLNYGSIPLGITVILWLAAGSLPVPYPWKQLIVILSFPIGFSGILLGIFQPRFMMPGWYRWLKENHADVLPLLREDVRRMGYDTWRKRTATQEGLERWVAEVRRKHGMERPKKES